MNHIAPDTEALLRGRARTSAIVILAFAAGAAAAGVDRIAAPAGAVAVTAIVVASLIAISIADVAAHRIPDRMTAAVAALAAGWLLVAAALPGGAGGWNGVWNAGVAAAVLAVLYLVLGLTGAVGLGDVKLAAALGLWVGGLGGTSWMLIPLLAIGISGAHQAVVRVRARPAPVAHGPALAVAGTACAAVTLLTG